MQHSHNNYSGKKADFGINGWQQTSFYLREVVCGNTMWKSLLSTWWFWKEPTVDNSTTRSDALIVYHPEHTDRNIFRINTTHKREKNIFIWCYCKPLLYFYPVKLQIILKFLFDFILFFFGRFGAQARPCVAFCQWNHLPSNVSLHLTSCYWTPRWDPDCLRSTYW